jgi:predicted DNA-binding protein (MmcQ/YjbR family)
MHGVSTDTIHSGFKWILLHINMNIEEIREYCLSKKGVSECFPFDDTTLVFKVMGKMFCLLNLDGEPGLLLKNTPEKVQEMRDLYTCVQPGFHMNKSHWNLVKLECSVSDTLLTSWIDESYTAVVGGMPRKLRNELQNLEI